MQLSFSILEEDAKQPLLEDGKLGPIDHRAGGVTTGMFILLATLWRLALPLVVGTFHCRVKVGGQEHLLVAASTKPAARSRITHARTLRNSLFSEGMYPDTNHCHLRIVC